MSRKCCECTRVLSAIGNSRVNGVDDGLDDWDSRMLHKGCFEGMKAREEDKASMRKTRKDNGLKSCKEFKENKGYKNWMDNTRKHKNNALDKNWKSLCKEFDMSDDVTKY